MPFLLRQVLENANSLDDAVRIIRNAKRTIGCNYVFADAKTKKACAVETTAHHFAAFYDNDAGEQQSVYARPVENAVMRADFAVNLEIRDLQTCAKGNPRKPGLEDPRGSSAYDKRYLGQAIFVKERYGAIDDSLVIELAKTIAPSSNVQSVVYAFPKIWVANAKGKARAVDSGFQEFDLPQLFEKK